MSTPIQRKIEELNSILENKASSGDGVVKSDVLEVLMSLAQYIKGGVVPEEKDIGYVDGQERPTLEDGVYANAYDSNAEAFFAGFDGCRSKVIDNFKELGL